MCLSYDLKKGVTPHSLFKSEVTQSGLVTIPAMFSQFLQSFETNREQELERCSGLEKEIEGLTASISDMLTNSDQLPNKQDFMSMKDDLAFRYCSDSSRSKFGSTFFALHLSDGFGLFV